MIKVKFEWTNDTEHDYHDYNKVVKQHENIPDQEFNNEKEMLDFALNKHQTIIVSSWRTDEVHFGLSPEATDEEKKYDYEIELYNDYRE